MDFVIGGAAAACTVVFSNPFDVVKTRMQLQGEMTRGIKSNEIYRNVVHAFYVIAKTDGLRSLQKGFFASLGFHTIFNGIRISLIEVAENNSLTQNKFGKPDVAKTLLIGSLASSVGGIVASPFYLIKTQIQTSSSISIAVGCQHQYTGTIQAFQKIYSKGGLKAFWYGWESAVPRMAFGSSVQLATFFRDIMIAKNILSDDNFKSVIIACNLSSFVLAIFMCPFDVIATRLYNQDCGQLKKIIYYNGIKDCATKIITTEGFFGIYKGVVPYFLRACPHSILMLYFFDTFKNYSNSYFELLG